MKRSIFIKNEQQMLDIARQMAERCALGTRIYLQGELGAGKTTFCRGFIRGCGHSGNVKSPTYTLVEPYTLDKGEVYHFDLYRLADPEELEYMGLSDYLASDAICLIEWPEKAGKHLPEPDLYCTISVTADLSGRNMQVTAYTKAGQQMIEGLF